MEGKNCPACQGKKIQTNKEGIKDLCPACKGTGKSNPPKVESVNFKDKFGATDSMKVIID